MVAKILKRMNGEELLLLKILNGKSVSSSIGAELDRRAMLGTPLSHNTEDFWAGRSFAMRHPLQVAA